MEMEMEMERYSTHLDKLLRAPDDAFFFLVIKVL